MNILVLGANGMAGHVVTLYFLKQNKHKVTSVSSHKKLDENTHIVDVTNFKDFDYFLSSNQFDVIINCIGILNQYADLYPDKAILLNSYLPKYLEARYSNTQTKIIHLSTDCVFSGERGSYKENDFRDGDTFYDRSKALGEIDNNKDLTFRMSIIGPDVKKDGIGLFNWFMKSKGEINGYKNAMWTGVTTIQLAKAIDDAILSNLTGLYHLVPNNSISKLEILCIFKTLFKRNDITINAVELPRIDKSLINTRTDFSHIIPDYKVMFEQMYEWIMQNRDLYPHYFNNSAL